MFYEALVLDNTEFFTKGTIRVRVPYFYNYKMEWDLANSKFDEVETGKNPDGTHNDVDAFLFAPLGGGDGYGTLIIPQINERGFIFFPENDYYKTAVWVGSCFRTYFDETGKTLQRINAPSNLIDKDGIDVNNDSTVNNDPEEKDNILIRTKNTEYENTDRQKMNWATLPTSNVISISNKGVKARHYNSEGGWKNNTAVKYTDLDITDDNIKLQANSTEDKSFITVEQTSQELTINKNNKTKITIDKDGNITVDTPKKVFFKNAETIEFLGNSRHLVGYEELYDALNTYVAHHIHITPNGPSQEPLDSSMAKLSAVMKSDLLDMKEKRLKTE